jgi:hypothetical protein
MYNDMVFSLSECSRLVISHRCRSHRAIDLVVRFTPTSFFTSSFMHSIFADHVSSLDTSDNCGILPYWLHSPTCPPA